MNEHLSRRHRWSEKGKKFEFQEPDNFLLGRDNDGSKAHFRLNNDDTQVSRNHFLLEINPPDCFIRDAGSLNGTFIVQPGSIVRLDKMKAYNQLNLQNGYGILTIISPKEAIINGDD